MIFLNLNFAQHQQNLFPILIGGHSKLALKRAARIGDGWISAGLSLDETKNLIDQINSFRDEFGTLDHPNYQFQVMGEAAYSPQWN
jgi:alkanesulfonate monooxygenase SsuD/methylene tetrahydromethanopterin reductase-like flavin-dependent oxidoreductase (luciferase family)